MDAGAALGQKLAVAFELKILKLSDEFGQYTLFLKCSVCGHERHAEPQAFAKLCGWQTSLEAVIRRLRCSKCGQKQCTWRAYPPSKPRGHTSLPR
jgi:rRNA maturation protein Nop10